MHVTERLKGESSKEYAMRVIRENIISLELEPGTSISANELASEIPVSRGPIREALSELSKIGIVEVYPQSGCKISMIDYTVVEEARFLRNTLECAIVKEACQVAEAVNILRLQENVNLQKFYMENHKTEELLEMDNEFHKYLFQFTNKIEIYNLMKNFDIHFDRIRSVSIRSVKNLKIVEDHEKILDCIRNSDEEEASKIMNIHLMRDKIDKEELKEKFFRNDKEKGLVIVNRRVDEYLKYKGFRVLVSDSEKDPVKAWTAYADRWRVEDAFATLKDRLGCNRIRCFDNKALQGKTFVQFIATGLSLMVRSRIRSYMKENKKAGKLNLVYESDSKILQVLNNVMQTRFNHGYYFDEVAGKKIKYFEALGVGVPGAGPETPEEVQDEPEVEPLLLRFCVSRSSLF